MQSRFDEASRPIGEALAAAPRWGIRQGRFCAARGSAVAGGSANTVNMPPRGAVGVGDRQQRRCAGRSAGTVPIFVRRKWDYPLALPEHQPRPVADVPPVVPPAPSPEKRCWPRNADGQDRLQASGRWLTCCRPTSRADMPPAARCCRPVMRCQDDPVVDRQDQRRIGRRSFHASARRQCANGTAQKNPASKSLGKLSLAVRGSLASFDLPPCANVVGMAIQPQPILSGRAAHFLLTSLRRRAGFSITIPDFHTF